MTTLRNMFCYALFTFISALVVSHPAMAVANNKTPPVNLQPATINKSDPGKTHPQPNQQAQCSQVSQDCDTRTRFGRSRADAAARDHHSEGHD